MAKKTSKKFASIDTALVNVETIETPEVADSTALVGWEKIDTSIETLATIETLEVTELPKVKEIPSGYATYSAMDTSTGTVFTTVQSANRGYVSALVCDSPFGLIVARWSKDHKGLVREQKRILSRPKGNIEINPQWGTVGLSAPRVVEVKCNADLSTVQATATTRRRETEWYGAQGLTGPSESAKIARAAAFAAAQAASQVHGPIQQME